METSGRGLGLGFGDVTPITENLTENKRKWKMKWKSGFYRGV